MCDVQTCLVEPKAFSLIVMQLHRAVAAAAARSTLSKRPGEIEHAIAVHDWLAHDSGSHAAGAPAAGVEEPATPTAAQEQAHIATTSDADHEQSSPARQDTVRWGAAGGVLSQAAMVAELAGSEPTSRMIAEHGRACANLGVEQVRQSEPCTTADMSLLELALFY